MPYTRCRENQIEQRIVYIQPDPDQLKASPAALNDRRLSLEQLREFGSAAGGMSEIPVRAALLHARAMPADRRRCRARRQSLIHHVDDEEAR